MNLCNKYEWLIDALDKIILELKEQGKVEDQPTFEENQLNEVITPAEVARRAGQKILDILL